ncbi:glycosyltransferase family 4 protein [Elizabethkingia sp. JS20170427COW]|uniref:glycosyltransferase family 4 protein n=1 Tax=Elizabethkingia sp. JS20170427COW TaxID=2583851 RepID=UPI00143D7C12|nr:glycosyltransferase family 4 protein [Elizabethkingia sp. JS20170427COW]
MKKKILILSEKPLDNYNVWSGTMYSMNQAFIEQGYITEWLPTPQYTPKQEKLFRFIEKAYHKIFNRGFNKMHFITKAWISSRLLKKEIKKREFDILFAPISAGIIPFLKIKQPIIYLNDANAAQLFNYNIMFTGFGWLSKKITCYLEKKTMQNAKVNVFSTFWAANYAVQHYKIPKKKVIVNMFGTNMFIPKNNEYTQDVGTFNILFFAGRWELKGGPIAYEAYKILKQKYPNILFTIVGCTPNLQDPDVKIIPFINKNTADGIHKIHKILTQTNILLLPTRNEAYGVVFCETAAFGIPSISTKTGGVPEIIVEGKTGYTLPLDAGAEEYAQIIENLILHPEQLQELSKNARQRYEEVLNWKVWGEKMKEVINHLS